MNTLREIHSRLINSLDNVYKRQGISINKSKIILGIVGARGVGKTTYILNHIKENYKNSTKALYVSADNIYFTKNNLFDLARKFVDTDGGELLCIDEIHRYKNWAQELKNIFDSFPKLKIVFSGSSSINIIEQKFDLSRRVILKKFPGLSFREWLEFEKGMSLPKLTLKQLTTPSYSLPKSISKISGILGLFEQYLKAGYYPVRKSLETNEEYFSALMSAVDKVIHQDIGTYYSLKTKTLSSFSKILYFVATTPPGKINPNSLALSLDKHHQDVANYLDMMKNSSLLRYLLIDKNGHALIRNAEKIFLDSTNLAYAVASHTGKKVRIGTIRENFAINQLQNANYKVFYSKSGDIEVDNNTFEIGRRNKGNKQIRDVKNAFLLKDGFTFKTGNSIPLYLLGFLY